MKKIIILSSIVLLNTIAFAETRDVALENKIIQAVTPIATSMKLVLDEAAIQRFDKNTTEVPFATNKNCEGVSACTVLVIYYNTSKNCNYGELGYTDHKSKVRNTYNLKSKNVCYQISTYEKKHAEKVAKALKKL